MSKAERVSQIKYIIEREQSNCEDLANINEECVRLSDEDILDIYWYAEKYLKDSLQVSRLVSIIMRILKGYKEGLSGK